VKTRPGGREAWSERVAQIDQHEPTGTRRDFLFVATGAAGGIATAAAVWPLINQMNPSADVQALSSIQVDVSGVDVGTQLTVKFLGKPVFIRHRTPEEIQAARDTDLSQLPDPLARNANRPADAPATDEDRSLDEAGEWLVMWGVCTHLGCVPLGEAGQYDGWFCPCHGSAYDTSGRIRQGPAPENLHIPATSFVSDGVIQLG
jgi:ubiquinol-cytochrome c reductase iron-sulfur subunit